MALQWRPAVEFSCVGNRKPARAPLRLGKALLVIRAAMTFTLAFRNLFHDRIRLAVTLVGILFSIVLVAVQLGLYLGARNIIMSMIDRSEGDLWVMAYGTKNFEEAQPISAREKFAALSIPGVAKAMPHHRLVHRLAQADRRIDAWWWWSAPTPRTAA